MGSTDGGSAGGRGRMSRASWDGGSDGFAGQDGKNNFFEQPAVSIMGATVGQRGTPVAGEASDTSTGSAKRRRMTFSGGDSTHQDGRGRPAPAGEGSANPHGRHQLQQRTPVLPSQGYDAQQQYRMHADQHGGTDRSQSNSNIVSSRDLEAMATASLRRANAENRRTTDTTGHLSAMPLNLAEPPLRDPRPVPQRQGSSTTSLETLHVQQRDAVSGVRTYGGDTVAASSHAGPSRSSVPHHPLGFVTAMPKGQDASVNLQAAGNDFTRRKGWAARVVDELLDFAHVLDPQGKILHATSSAYSLTGWKSHQLQEMSIFDIVHPQDVPILQREMQKAAKDADYNITLYYRMRRNPQLVASRGRQRLAKTDPDIVGKLKAARSSQIDRNLSSTPVDTDFSCGTSSTPDDNSSLPQNSDSTSLATKRVTARPVTLGEVDPDAEWVTVEMTGHAYFPPLPAADTEAEDDDKAGDDLADDEVQIPADSPAVSTTRKRSNDDKKAKAPGEGSTGSDKLYKLPLKRATEVQCFFCSCRVYPSKSVTMLDSFLELKLENEKLRLQLEQLKIEGGDIDSGDEDSENGDGYAAAQEGDDSEDIPRRPSMGEDNQGHGLNVPVTHADAGATPGQRSRDSGRTASGEMPLQQRKADGSQHSHPRGSSTSDGSGATGSADHARGGGKNQPADLASSATAEPALGHTPGSLHRSRPSQHGTPSNASGNHTSSSTQSFADAQASKKKKPKEAEEEDRVCTDCGRTDSPEWRKGPLGPKTLCNACGLRFAKKFKRKGGPSVTIPDGFGVGGGMVSPISATPTSAIETPGVGTNWHRPAYSTVDSFANPSLGGMPDIAKQQQYHHHQQQQQQQLAGPSQSSSAFAYPGVFPIPQQEQLYTQHDQGNAGMMRQNSASSYQQQGRG